MDNENLIQECESHQMCCQCRFWGHYDEDYDDPKKLKDQTGVPYNYCQAMIDGDEPYIWALKNKK